MLHRLTIAALSFALGTAAIAGTPGLDKREQHQQRRIEQGVASGELTKPEAKRMERSENRLERHEDKAKSDGVVTASERARLHNEADRNSARIYRQKHDSQKRN